MGGFAPRVDLPRVGIEHLAEAATRARGTASNGRERRAGRLIKGEMTAGRLADDHRAHRGDVVTPVNAGPFQGELVAGIQRAASGLVAGTGSASGPEPMMNSLPG